MINNNRDIARLIEYSSLFTAILIFTGLTRNLIFWREFNVDIFNYISFSEIIMYSFDIVLNHLKVPLLLMVTVFIFRKQLGIWLKYVPILLLFILTVILFLTCYALYRNANILIFINVLIILLILAIVAASALAFKSQQVKDNK